MIRTGAAFVCTSDTHHQSHFDLRFFASLSHNVNKAAKFDVKRNFDYTKRWGRTQNVTTESTRVKEEEMED
jgi:hypothetical protein